MCEKEACDSDPFRRRTTSLENGLRNGRPSGRPFSFAALVLPLPDYTHIGTSIACGSSPDELES